MSARKWLKCHRCAGFLMEGKENGRSVLFCRRCQEIVEEQQERDFGIKPSKPVALKLPGMDRGKQETAIRETEEGIMQRILGYWRARGLGVLCTVHRYKVQICSKCGNRFWPKAGYGATKGIGDILVPVKVGPYVLYRMQDVKGPSGKPTPEQEALVGMNALAIIRSHEDSEEDVRKVKEAVG